MVGCGALHVMWEDLAEIRTVAVDPAYRGHRIGHRIVTELIDQARELGRGADLRPHLRDRASSPPSVSSRSTAPRCRTPVYEQLLRSYDEGVAEFLGLERVKPNTLGNTRMLLRL